MTQEPSQFSSSPDIERKHGRLYKQQVAKEKHHNSCCFNCLRFCLKKRRDMEQRGQTEPPQIDLTAGGASEGGLRELITAWFLQSQASLISHNGLFPNWFLGFTSRKDAEDILMTKDVGCFLVRLSDKALGYILSYRQVPSFCDKPSDSGQFVVFGHNVQHTTISELIQYFKEKPIEPFGEYLTTSCFGSQKEPLYDTIQVSPKGRTVATVHAQKVKKHLSNQGPERLLTQSRAKNINRTSEEIPPLPRRSRHLENGITIENQDSVCYAQVRRKKAKDRELKGDLRPQSLYSELDLLDSRCRSLPLLLNSSEEQNYRLSVTPPRPGRDTPSPSPTDRTCTDWQAHRLVLSLEPEQRTQGCTLRSLQHTAPKWTNGRHNDKWKRLFPEVKRKW
ncbi:hypothetical protein WMY93_023490 [Mugilogobius chulae]|uniref:SH2 domain-containing protein n=1 Tax=Mugilogobius chulae TaxID=88201 RepID=A0AAW0NGK7_9GOBI